LKTIVFDQNPDEGDEVLMSVLKRNKISVVTRNSVSRAIKVIDVVSPISYKYNFFPDVRRNSVMSFFLGNNRMPEPLPNEIVREILKNLKYADLDNRVQEDNAGDASTDGALPVQPPQ